MEILLITMIMVLSMSLGYVLANIDWKKGEWKEW
jgi:hypothetical protein